MRQLVEPSQNDTQSSTDPPSGPHVRGGSGATEPERSRPRAFGATGPTPTMVRMAGVRRRGTGAPSRLLEACELLGLPKPDVARPVLG
jgi:hypothetical protein